MLQKFFKASSIKIVPWVSKVRRICSPVSKIIPSDISPGFGRPNGSLFSIYSPHILVLYIFMIIRTPPYSTSMHWINIGITINITSLNRLGKYVRTKESRPINRSI
uniref:Uncharacterized protein n=1 Tax=Opuntia streptacantha TaxID=393608 RepID=A0A7C9EBI8_OPUST